MALWKILQCFSSMGIVKVEHDVGGDVYLVVNAALILLEYSATVLVAGRM